MRVSVRLFAGLRERAGRSVVEVELPEGARVADALAALDGLTGGQPVVMAVNRRYAAVEEVLESGDELALIPPVSGGAPDPRAPVSGGAPDPRASAPHIHVRITDGPLSLDRLLELVRDPRAGALVSFLGVTREVQELDYEAYPEMAEPVLRAVATEAAERHGLCAAAVEHRVGTVALGEPSVAIAVSAPHRAEAFAGARQVIDQLKARAPIWKREEGVWVPGALPGQA